MSEERPDDDRARAGYRGWAGGDAAPTTLALVRHGVTDHTVRKLFSGGLTSANPGLNDTGREQAGATAEWLRPLADRVGALVSSPVRRALETAEIVGEVLGRTAVVEPAIAEMDFGTWDGLSFAEVKERFPDELTSWLGDLDHGPGGGESFRSVHARVTEGRDRVLTTYAGQLVVAVSHVTPIKTLVADALGAPLEAVYRTELSAASVSVISYYPRSDGAPGEGAWTPSLRLFNGVPGDVPAW